MKKIIKVQLVHHSNDDYNELWKVIGTENCKREIKFLCRHVYSDSKSWYYVSDPLGYCELDYAVKEDVEIHVYNSRKEFCFITGNGIDYYQFPSIEQSCKSEWKKLGITPKSENAEVTLKDWLASYLTPQICKDNNIDYRGNCGELNWTDCWYHTKEIKAIRIFNFEGDGNAYAIFKVTQKHNYCDCEWNEYFSGKLQQDEEYKSYIQYFGCDYPDTHGEMYSTKEATKEVVKALKEIYPEHKGIVSIPMGKYPPYERKMKLYEAARLLLNGEYEREKVKKIIIQEKKKPTMYTDRKKLQEDYPNIVMDYSVKLY